MIGFRLGDLWTDTFTYQGQACRRAGVSLKARLLFVSWIKVDGKLVYKAEPKPTDADDRDERDVRNTDVPATSAEPQAATPEPSRPAAEAADEAAADAPALEVAESF